MQVMLSKVDTMASPGSHMQLCEHAVQGLTCPASQQKTRLATASAMCATPLETPMLGSVSRLGVQTWAHLLSSRAAMSSLSCLYWPQPLPRSARPAVRVMALKASITARNSPCAGSMKKLKVALLYLPVIVGGCRGEPKPQFWHGSKIADAGCRWHASAYAGLVEEVYSQGRSSPGGSPHPAQPAASADPASPSESGAQTASRR